jgi:hypothetical protein
VSFYGGIGRAIDDVFTQVIGMARKAGLAQLGHVAIDSSRTEANSACGSVVEQRISGRHPEKVSAWEQNSGFRSSDRLHGQNSKVGVMSR